MNSEDRFRRLVDEHGEALARYVRRRFRAEEWDTLINDTFVIAWQRLGELPEGLERAWLYGAARRLGANVVRRDRRRLSLVEKVAGLRIMHSPDTAELAMDHVAPLDRRLHDTLMALSPAEREILLLVAWESLGPAELAVVLSISDAAARQRLSRARRRARAFYDSDTAVVGSEEKRAGRPH